MKTLILAIICLVASAVSATVSQNDFAQYVNPYIGCSFNGHCFAAASYPFGLVQAGPDTGTESWDYCSGYRYADTNIFGFSQTHLSGTGSNDLGDVLLMPWVGDGLKANVSSKYRKETQIASPGYYAVTLDDAGVDVEIAVAPHSAIYRFTYTKDGKAQLMLDAQWGIVFPDNLKHHVLESDVRQESATRFVGRNVVNNWVNREFSFALETDHAIKAVRTLPVCDSAEKALRYILDFDLKKGDTLQVKIAISSTDINGAKKNLAAEIPEWDFASVKNSARNEWNKYLSRMELTEGSADEKANFYTSLYHLCIQPNNIADVDGRYRGADGKVHKSKDGKYFSTLSLWDTFRAAHPLYTIIAPELVPLFINTMLEQHMAIGYLPIWTLWGKENQGMIGTHSVPVMVDAYLKGFKGIDWNVAWDAINNSLRAEHKDRVKERWDLVDKYGYYPFDEIIGESVSRLLECAYDDWCAAKLAKALGKTDDAAFFEKRAQNYRNVFDKENKLVHGRDTKGNWRTPFDPFELGHGADTANDYTEGNSWQYTWHVMHDPYGLISLFGSKKEFADKLDALFVQAEKVEGSGFIGDVTGLIGQYAHGNEPSHHVAYFFQFADRPTRTAEIVREICDKFYLNKIDGLCGNDDCGQMSAWYLFSVAGFYPFNPCGGEYVLGAPQVPGVKFTLSNGKTFFVKALGISRKNKYVKSVTLNGKPLKGFILTHDQIMAGGELVFEMYSR